MKDGITGKVRSILLKDDGTFPNNPKWPLLIYREAFSMKFAGLSPLPS
jgi:uncharacterized protein YjlB